MYPARDAVCTSRWPCDGGRLRRQLNDLGAGALLLGATNRAIGLLVLDLDAIDDSLHGHREGRFFRGYYDCYCYLPLYIFCGDHLLAAKLRRSNIDASAGAADEVALRQLLVAHAQELEP